LKLINLTIYLQDIFYFYFQKKKQYKTEKNSTTRKPRISY